MEDDLRCKDKLKEGRMWPKGLRAKLEEKSEEILSVALLSPACFAISLAYLLNQLWEFTN